MLAAVQQEVASAGQATQEYHMQLGLVPEATGAVLAEDVPLTAPDVALFHFVQPPAEEGEQAPAEALHLPPSETHKVCSKCKENKLTSEFHKSKRRKLGLHIYCKTCCSTASSLRQKQKTAVLVPTVDHKVCSKCGVDKPAGDYFRDKWRTTGLCSYCKACSQQAVAIKHQQGSLQAGPTVDYKVCTKCKLEKAATEFHRNTLTASGLVSRCKTCIAAADQKRYEKMKAKEKASEAERATQAKECSQCRKVKPGSEFSPNWTSPDGLRSNCKACQSNIAARSRQYKQYTVHTGMAVNPDDALGVGQMYGGMEAGDTLVSVNLDGTVSLVKEDALQHQQQDASAFEQFQAPQQQQQQHQEQQQQQNALPVGGAGVQH